MKRSLCAVGFTIFLYAVPSWGQSGVIVDGREWLQPVDFTGYTYDEVNAVCSDGACSGTLPGSAFDLTGYTWASVKDVSILFNAYGASPPFAEPFQYSGGDDAAIAFSQDFAVTGSWCFGDCPYTWVVVAGMVRDPAAPEEEPEAEPKAAAYMAYNDVGDDPGFANTSRLISAPDDSIGAWLFRQVEDPHPAPEMDFVVNLEEPINLDTHSGIGNLRGWAISEDGIDRVEIHIDGEYRYDAPYGGERADVAEAHPDIDDSDQSGFSLAFGYSNLEIGEHTITARAFNNLGESLDSTSTFEVEAFHKDFINQWDIVDVSQASIGPVEGRGSEIELSGVMVDGEEYELILRWRPAEQGFEIIEIKPRSP